MFITEKFWIAIFARKLKLQSTVSLILILTHTFDIIMYVLIERAHCIHSTLNYHKIITFLENDIAFEIQYKTRHNLHIH